MALSGFKLNYKNHYLKNYEKQSKKNNHNAPRICHVKQ